MKKHQKSFPSTHHVSKEEITDEDREKRELSTSQKECSWETKFANIMIMDLYIRNSEK